MSDERTVNVPLLRKAVEWAEAEAAKPAALCEWEQSTWVVPRTCDDAQQWGYGPWADRTTEWGRAAECGTCYCIAGYVVAQTKGPLSTASIAVTAADELGIDLGTAMSLFYSENSIEDVRRIAESLAGERL